MKLAMILETPQMAGGRKPVTPEDDPGALAQELAGPEGQAQNEVRKRLEQQQKVQAKPPKPAPATKRSLQQLQNVPWDSKNSKFKQLAGELMGAAK